MMEQKGFEGQVSKESVERGKNVRILLKIIRHGLRNPKDNMLTDIGRDITREKAIESSLSGEDFDYVKAIGSTVGPYAEVNVGEKKEKMGRALETAHIYANEIASDDSLNTRPTEVLSYTEVVSKVPYNHTQIYNANLPENFESLSDEEKVEAQAKAQIAVTEHILGLTGHEAEQYRKEAAGSIAYLITHYQEVAHRLKSGKKALIPAGSHGSFMEFLMKAALVRKDVEGKEIRGFSTLDEIGGPHSPSEAFTIDVETDESGNDKPLKFTFDDTDRPNLGEMELDRQTVEELAEFYKSFHPELRALRSPK